MLLVASWEVPFFVLHGHRKVLSSDLTLSRGITISSDLFYRAGLAHELMRKTNASS